MHPSISISKALESSLPIIDVRSPKEYGEGHILGAQNVPLLNNEERIIIGTTYRKKGSEEAVKKGYELVGPRFSQIKQELQKYANNQKVIIYCWRGGQRSEVSCDLAKEQGLEYCYIEGGYKSYRRWAHDVFSHPKKVFVVSGRTGSGKTELLYMLQSKGFQIIDLEKYANHKGSAFGALGQGEQPRQEIFENNLAVAWNNIDPNQIVFIENESRMVGQIFIPPNITKQIIHGHVIEIDLPVDMRCERILKEYAHFPKQDLIACASKLKKRLGNLRLQNIVSSINEGTLEWIILLIEYYDSCYQHSKIKRGQEVSMLLTGADIIDIYKKICEIYTP